jgi:hypothetical protein
MIRPVSDTSQAKAGARASAKPQAAASRGFAAEMARAQTTAAKHAAPKGERTRPVADHHYAEIVAGPRNGMYLNTSDNERSGQAFLIVTRADRTFHVYGSGADRKVVEVPTHHSTQAAPATATPAATTASPA